MEPNIWLAPIKENSWRKIKEKKIYGVPLKQKKILDQTYENDEIIFYIYAPINGIIGITKIISRPYVDYTSLWSKVGLIDKYSYRVKLEILNQNILDKREVIPLYEVFGYEDIKKEYTIEPYLNNIILTKISLIEREMIISKVKNLQNLKALVIDNSHSRIGVIKLDT